MQKHFVREQELLEDSFRLAVRIHNSGWRATQVAGLWPGGASVGIYVQECLRHLGWECGHGVLSAPCQHAAPVWGLRALSGALRRADRLLIVDDVFASGASTRRVVAELAAAAGEEMPREVKIATIWYRPPPGAPDTPPDFFLHRSAHWLVMPGQIVGLAGTELDRCKPGLRPLLASALARRAAAR